MLIFFNLYFMPEFIWFYFSMIGWGIGLFFHAMGAFRFNPFFGKNWEEKKIREMMEKEKSKNNNQYQ
jgi:2TM domain-containing protein